MKNYCFLNETIKNIENEFYKTADSKDILMERAGVALYNEIILKVKNKQDKIVVLAGGGNNGGDGYVAARLLKNDGYNASVCAHFEPKSELCIEKRASFKGEVFSYSKSAFKDAAVLVDCVFGTGFKGELEEQTKKVFADFNLSSAFKISADIPSGLSADSNVAEKGCIKPDITLTFIGFKACQLFFPAAEFCGKLKLFELGLSEEFLNGFDNFGSVIDGANIKKRLRNTHKGSFGTATLVCGSFGMAGAAVLAARSCLRSGVGLAKVVCDNSIYPIITACVPEAVCLPLPNFETQLNKTMNSCECVLVGCGLSTDNSAKLLLEKAFACAQKTLIVDADGINLLASCIELAKSRKAELILTPHPKEMARLLKTDVSDIEANRLHYASLLAKELDCTVVLKGAVTVVAVSDGSVYFNIIGNSGMATGGSGDVLSGMIASFCAQGYTVKDAVKNAVYLHAKAGDIAKERLCEESLLPSDIIEALPAAFKSEIKQ